MSSNYASKAVNLAKTQVGYAETGNNITKYAKDFDTKYPDFYNTKKQGAEWCDIFFDWLMVTSFGETEALRMTCQPKKSCGAGCKFSYGYYKAKGRVGKTPKFGAQIFFSNKGTKADINHTGIVVDIKGDTVYTIEGNKNNKVSECSYKTNNVKIYGYGYPYYDDEIKAEVLPLEPMKYEPIKPKTLNDIDTVARQVIAGQWGNDPERSKRLTNAGYNASDVQKQVNLILNSMKPTEPTYTMYLVQSGDTLWDIAKKCLGSGTRYKEIKDLNGLKSDVIRVGMKLKIPKR